MWTACIKVCVDVLSICYTCKHVSFTKLILWFHLYSWISIFVDSMKFKVPRKRKFLVNDRITILVELHFNALEFVYQLRNEIHENWYLRTLMKPQ